MSDTTQDPDADPASSNPFSSLDTSDKIAFVVGIAISLGHVYMNMFAVLPSLLQNAIHFAGFAFLCALIYPVALKKDGSKPSWHLPVNLILGLIAAGASMGIILSENAIYDRGLRLTTMEWGLSIVTILMALEFTRRVTGWFIPCLIVLSLTYIGWWGAHIDGIFKFAGLSWETILFRSLFSDEGLFGTIARISSTFVFMFILFGAFLIKSGAGNFVIDLARAVAGRLTGGPGLVAVFASSLTGTISGSAVANTASTGVITIPLMKRAGFPPKFAAAVEASASTGGQLMPPIMGAGAFVMASYTQISYTTIVAVSVLPAILYFATVAFFVRIEAKRHNIGTGDGEEAPKFATIMRQGGISFLFPIVLLITVLIMGFTPTYAAGVAILAVIASSWLTPNKMGPKQILEAFALGARNMVLTAVLLCSVGLIVNVIATAGVGNTFSLMISDWADNNLLIAMILVGLASLVLGMGLPVTASYIVLATLSAPALYAMIADTMLVEQIANGTVSDQAKAILMLAAPEKLALIGQPMSSGEAAAIVAAIPVEMSSVVRESMIPAETLGYALLAAHLIIFWLSQDSNVTPPVCLTAFTAAAIAKTPPMATGVTSWKVAKGLYLVPLLFAYTPLIGAPVHEALVISAFALVGLYGFTAAIQGYMEAPLNIVERLVAITAAAACAWPGLLAANFAGVAVIVGLFLLSMRREKAAAASAAA